jgi:hypothetical protein
MKVKFILFIAGFSLIVLSAGFFQPQATPPPKSVDLIVMKVGDVWKVVDATNHKKIVVHVKKKDTITWTVQGSNAYFQFPDKLFDPAGKEDSLKNGYIKSLKNGKKLKLKVKDDAALGTYEYAVFITADAVFAQGDSPPKIIIE